MLQPASPATSARMKRVKQSNTEAELAVRRLLSELGVSYRTCVRTLPGSPDIVNQRAGWAMFVHGCFWHGHTGCKRFTTPKSNKKFWTEKVDGNRKRDARKARALRACDLRVITVWECETKDPDRLARRLRRVLECETLQMGGNERAFLRGARPRLARPTGELRVVDLFSGCGGLTLGAEEAARLAGRSLSVRLAVERDAPAAETYAKNFAPAYGADASEITDWFDSAPGAPRTLTEQRTLTRVGDVDLLVGGPPCQGHSTLNNHTRGDDPKNGLYLAMVRATEVLEPNALIIENVPALERDSKQTLDTAIKRLERMGYKVDHGVVCVADIGVPQMRRRHVLVAHATMQPDLEAAMNTAHTSARTLRWAIGDLGSAYGSRTFDTASALSPENEKRARYLLKHRLHDLPNTKRPACQRDEHKYKSMYGRMWWTRPAQTVTTGFGSPGQGRYLHPVAARTLTPHEAARVQFFPDWFDFTPLKHRGHLARAIGNAVPPKLAFVLAHHLLSLDVAQQGAGREFQTVRGLLG